MTTESTPDLTPTAAAQTYDPMEVRREAVVMAIYVSVVLDATLEVLPEGHGSGDWGHGIYLLGVIWGATLGLAIAHWFAFRVAAFGFSDDERTRTDHLVARAQFLAAFVIAAAASVPAIILYRSESADQVTQIVPSLAIGLGGFLSARAAKKSKLLCVVIGLCAMLLGFFIAEFKYILAGHF